MVEQAGAAGDHEPGPRMRRAQEDEGLQQPARVLAPLDAADRQHARSALDISSASASAIASASALARRAQAEPRRHVGVVRARHRVEARAVDAVGDALRGEAVVGVQPVAPHPADAQQPVGGADRALLPALHQRVVEAVDVVHGAQVAGHDAALLQVGQRVGADAVVGVEHVVAGVAPAAGEVGEERGHAGAHHLRQVAVDARPRRRHRHQFDAAARVAKHRLARRGRRHHRHLVAGAGQRAAEFEHVHHAAARVHRMGQQGDAQARQLGRRDGSGRQRGGIGGDAERRRRLREQRRRRRKRHRFKHAPPLRASPIQPRSQPAPQHAPPRR